MLFAFVDESYTRDRYYIAAFVVNESQLLDLRAANRRALEYAAGFGVDPDSAELHGYEIMSGDKEWSPLRGKHRAAHAIYSRALREMGTLPRARAFVEGVDVARLNARYSYPEPPHRVVLRHLLEVLNSHARLTREEVLVIADEVPDQEDHARRMAAYQTVTTGGYKPSKLQHVQFPITFGRSVESPGLQAADLIAYLYRRLDAHKSSGPKAERTARALWADVAPLKPRCRRWDP
ncbi:DUF3800 domain-containing protein [Microcella indica]|uniref:DUF3800 domain-containing protein n=1 Tax=Microcella indica TaxID=2750620 RepID=UPI0015CF2845|nr:DUF3800 domain-containing protein [Microcella indica]